MPITQPELYPENWQTLAAEIKAACGYICGECGKQCRCPGEPFDTHKRTLTISHYFSDYTSDAIFVAALCAPCHILHDMSYHIAARRRNRHIRVRQAGQLSFLRSHSRECTSADVAELEACWPGHGYLETLPDGVDCFADYPIIGQEGR